MIEREPPDLLHETGLCEIAMILARLQEPGRVAPDRSATPDAASASRSPERRRIAEL
jgi:hypothetical protein